MIKNDRGTVMFLRFFKTEATEPIVINTQEKRMSGIIINGVDLDKTFEKRSVVGASKYFKKQTIAAILILE